MVTCPWWDEIYINEAWGSIGGYLGPRLAKSNVDTDIAWEEDYLATQGFSGLDTDGRLSSRPMVSQNLGHEAIRIIHGLQLPRGSQGPYS